MRNNEYFSGLEELIKDVLTGVEGIDDNFELTPEEEKAFNEIFDMFDTIFGVENPDISKKEEKPKSKKRTHKCKGDGSCGRPNCAHSAKRKKEEKPSQKEAQQKQDDDAFRIIHEEQLNELLDEFKKRKEMLETLLTLQEFFEQYPNQTITVENEVINGYQDYMKTLHLLEQEMMEISYKYLIQKIDKSVLI